ncbi:MAG: hypothetical protein MUC56_05290 [Thermoanaerobaculales bacterium]|jgi:hypothetical protein|nr:hypothetical protein [Thermoanaerobaculales bacterium]
MHRSPALDAVLFRPTPDALWELRAELLEAGDTDPELLAVVGAFHHFLSSFATATTTRDLNHLASKLDISAVGGVVLEQMLERAEPHDLARRVLTGAISEGLMVLASRQYVRGAEGEIAALLRDAAWDLYDRLWRWTSGVNPELGADERRRLLEALLGPLRSPDAPSPVKAALAGRLYQVLLVGQLDGR